MRTTLLMILLLWMVSCASAQDSPTNFNVGIGPTLMLPVGSSSDVFDAAYGGTVQLAVQTSNAFTLLAHSGYQYFNYAENGNDTGDFPKYWEIPVLAGAALNLGNIQPGLLAGVRIQHATNTDVQVDVKPQLSVLFNSRFSAQLGWVGLVPSLSDPNAGDFRGPLLSALYTF